MISDHGSGGNIDASAPVEVSVLAVAVPPLLCLTELLDQRRPQAPSLRSVLKRGLDHDKLRGRIDADPLAVLADRRELATRSRQQPQQVNRTPRRRGPARREIGVGRGYRRRIDPLHRYDLSRDMARSEIFHPEFRPRPYW